MKFVAACLAAFGLLLCAASAEAAKRVALVLGNGAYAHASALPNPRRDAEGMAAALERLGFEVELGVDLDLAGMRRAVQAYARKLVGAEVALFYYAGHGMQVHGENYLLPVDADIGSEVDLDFAALPARLILSQMDRWPATKIVILDACRDNPFATALSRSMGPVRASTALSRGLAQIEAAGGSLLAYATDPGDVAADGTGANSPFTAALLDHLETPGVEIHTMLARVRADVFHATGQRQRPWTESSLIGEFFLAPAEPEAPPVTTAMLAPSAPDRPEPPASALDPRQIELAVWGAAQAGGTAEDYREYLRQYPNGIFANLARNRLAALERQAARPEEPGGAAEPSPEPATEPPLGRNSPDQAPGAGATEEAIGPEEAAPPTGSDAAEASGPSPSAETNAPGSEPVGDPGSEPEAPSDEAELAFAPDPLDPPGAAAAAEKELGLGRVERREVQARLMVAGHDPRGIDGVFGPGTRAAISAWQEAEGLRATGYLDAAALDLLERRTGTAYAAWVERQRAEEARRAAAARERAEREAARAAAKPEPVRSPAAAGPVETPALATPGPGAAPQNPPAAPAPEGGSARERYEQDCYFVTTGTTELKRICR